MRHRVTKTKVGVRTGKHIVESILHWLSHVLRMDHQRIPRYKRRPPTKIKLEREKERERENEKDLQAVGKKQQQLLNEDKDGRGD